MQKDLDQHHSAVIIKFPRKRGRPRLNRTQTDCGTPELIAKRKQGVTTEALDLCLQRKLITAEQHWCGMHLRWLHTLRHGTTGLRAIDPTHFGGRDNKLNDPAWRLEREQEYNLAISALASRGCAKALINICVYDEKPTCLTMKAMRTAKSQDQTLALLYDGLSLLSQLWRKPV